MKKIELPRLFSRHYNIPNDLSKLTKDALAYNKIRNPEITNAFKCLAFGFKKSMLLSVGRNIFKPTKYFKNLYVDKHKMSLHAEIDLLLKLYKYNIKNKVTDIVLIRGVSKPLPSFPCESCEHVYTQHFTNISLWVYDSDFKLSNLIIRDGVCLINDA